MIKNKIWFGIFIVCFLIVPLFLKAQSYTLDDPTTKPFLAVDDTRNRIEVYVVKGVDDLKLSYTPQNNSTSVIWHRYTQKALESTLVQGEREGDRWTLRNLQGGSGYYAEEEGVLARYIWIVDYDAYTFKPSSLQVVEGSDPCSSVRLQGDIDPKTITYYTPSGLPAFVDRQFAISYETLRWNDFSKAFDQVDTTFTVKGNPFEASYSAPLCDTQFTLEGDRFATYFDTEIPIQTDLYQAVAVEAHADTVMTLYDTENTDASEGLSAPVDIHFTGYANTPVASMLIWKIYRQDLSTTATESEETAEEPIVRFVGDQLDYTFNESGLYRAVFEVADRTGACVDELNSFEIRIQESMLHVPNAFSPGTTPGINDVFKVNYKSLLNFKAWIYNRWGQQLYHWVNPAEGWDGKQGGNYVAPGVYFYLIEAQGSDGIHYKKKGAINILRSKNIQETIDEVE